MSREELIRRLEERYRRGEISYETYMNLRAKYSVGRAYAGRLSGGRFNVKIIVVLLIVVVGVGLWLIVFRKPSQEGGYVETQSPTPTSTGPPTQSPAPTGAPGDTGDWGLALSMQATIPEASGKCGGCYVVTAESDLYRVDSVGKPSWNWKFRFYCPAEDTVFSYWCINMKPEFEEIIGIISAADIEYSEVEWGISPGEAYRKALESGGGAFITEHGEENVYVVLTLTTKELAVYYRYVSPEISDKIGQKYIYVVDFLCRVDTTLHEFKVVLDSMTGQLITTEHKG